MLHQKIEILLYLFKNEERLNFSNASFIESKVPLESCLLSNTRHSKKVNLGSMVSGSTKKMYTTCSLMLESVLPSQNMEVKFTHKSFLYIYIYIFLKKNSDGFNEIATTTFISIWTRLKLDSMIFFELDVSLNSVNGCPFVAI